MFRRSERIRKQKVNMSENDLDVTIRNMNDAGDLMDDQAKTISHSQVQDKSSLDDGSQTDSDLKLQSFNTITPDRHKLELVNTQAPITCEHPEMTAMMKQMERMAIQLAENQTQMANMQRMNETLVKRISQLQSNSHQQCTCLNQQPVILKSL